MLSPSSRRLNLMVPCDAGCDGPIWISISSVAGSDSRKRDGVSAPGAFAMRSDSAPRGPGVHDRVALGHERLALRDGVVPAQRVADELRVHEDASQIRVAVEADAEHVPGLALGPDRALPEAGSRGDDRVVLGDRGLDADAVVESERVELVDHLEAGH